MDRARAGRPNGHGEPDLTLAAGGGYLKATLEAIAAGHPASRIDELMPWNFDKKS